MRVVRRRAVMGKVLSTFIRSVEEGQWADGEKGCELRLSWALALALQKHQQNTKRKGRKRAANGAPSPAEVVPDEVDVQLKAQLQTDRTIMAAYIRRAMAAEPQVDRLEYELRGQLYCMPRVTLTEPMMPEERGAFSKNYLSRAFARANELKRRRDSVLERIGVDSDYLLVDATGYAATVVVRNVFSDVGLRGKRALHADTALHAQETSPTTDEVLH